MSEQKWYEKLSIFQKLKNIKHIEIIVAVIFGIIIFLVYLSTTSSSSLFSSNTGQTTLEERLSSILDDIDGAGNVSVFVNTGENDSITGIIIVSSGADKVSVKLNILSAIETVLNVPTANIQILVGNKWKGDLRWKKEQK